MGPRKCRVLKVFDLENALETPMALKFRFLYDTTDRETLKLHNCAVGSEEFAPIDSRQPFTQNGI